MRIKVKRDLELRRDPAELGRSAFVLGSIGQTNSAFRGHSAPLHRSSKKLQKNSEKALRVNLQSAKKLARNVRSTKPTSYMYKKLIPLLLLTASLVPLPTRANDIEPTKEFYTAAFTAAPITVDGLIDQEWSGFPILADPKFAIPKGSGAAGRYVLFEEYNGGTWTGPDDQTSAVQIAYDADNVYFGFVVTDDYHENAANSAWNGDSVQLMIANGDRSAQVALYNYALGGTDNAGYGATIVMHEAGPGGTTAVVTRDPAAKKTYYEIQLPASSLGLTELTPGTKFGLGMAINDGDELTPGQRGWGGLGAHAIVFGKTPSQTALVTLGANVTTIDILGIGASALLGGDLTDPENDGLDALGAKNDPSWNWAGITASHEPDFEGGEFAFNIFDNKVGGGNDKWCCDDPTPGNPVWVAVEFGIPVSLTHFTVTSGNDTPGRDPTDWAIQGSTDGVTYRDIYHLTANPAPWTARNQVVLFTLPAPSALFRYIRYIAYETPANLHQINEIEYFGIAGGLDKLYLSAVSPKIQSFSFRANDAGTSIVNPASGKLKIDGVSVPLTATPTAGAVDFAYLAPAPFLPSSSHTYSIEVKDVAGNKVTSDGSFKTEAYIVLTAADKVTPDLNKAGFIWAVHQNSAFTANDNLRPFDQLAGLLGENFVDPAAQGVAIDVGTPDADPNRPITFEIDTVINMSQSGGQNNGSFGNDGQMPGFPSTDGSGGNPNGIAGQITTYIELPAGKHVLVVNSDDGFLTSVGSDLDDILLSRVAGEFSGGRGAADTSYTVFAQTAGVYGFRTTWEEGGGGANIEWKERFTTGDVLLNDRLSDGGVPTYRALAAPLTKPYISRVSPGVNSGRALPTAAIQVVIQERTTAVDNGSVQLFLDGAALTPVIVDRVGQTLTVSHQPASPLANATHTARVRFTYGGTERIAEWSFTVNATVDKLHSYPGLIISPAKRTPNAGGHTGAAGDYAIDLGTSGNAGVLVPDASWLNDATVDDALTFSMWIKKYDNADSSAFWADSPTSNNGQRGFQAHVPWSNGHIYFDTAGCCGANTRIEADGATFPGYTDANWWKAWHHYVFVKNLGVKTIYIDGEVFLDVDGTGTTSPLPTDFVRLWLGQIGGGPGGGGGNMHALMDDFAAFGSGLGPDDVQALFNGTLPSALTAANPLAWWPFNDVPLPKLSISRVGNLITVTWTGGGELQVSDKVNGPWATVAGATSPLVAPMDRLKRFARVRVP